MTWPPPPRWPGWYHRVLAALLVAGLSRCAAAGGISCSDLEVVPVTDAAAALALSPGRWYQLGPGTFTLANTTIVAKGEVLCIAGASAAATKLLPPAAGGHHVRLAGSLALRDLTIQGGAGSGGVIVTQVLWAPPHKSALEAESVVFASNGLRAVTSLEDPEATLTFNHCSFVGNVFTTTPGIAGGGAVATISGAQFGGARTELLNNACSRGGGGAVWAWLPPGAAPGPRLEFGGGELVVEGNWADGDGGGVYASGIDVVVNTTTSTWSGNRVANGTVAGGALALSVASAVFSGTVAFVSNTASAFGGAVAALAGPTEPESLTFEGDVLFARNQAGQNGGALRMAYLRLAARSGLTCTDNAAGNQGGCVEASGSLEYTAPVEFGGAVVLRGNHARTRGGAVFVAYADLLLTGPTVTAEGNLAIDQASGAGEGGAIWAGDSAVRLEGDTMMANNSAGGRGGAMYLVAGKTNVNGPLKLLNNRAAAEGGAVNVYYSKFTANGSVTAVGNTAAQGGAFFVASEQGTRNGFFGSSLFADNVALTGSPATQYGLGGAVLAIGGGAVLFGSSSEDQTIFRNNTAAVAGGALSAYGAAQVKVTGALTLEGNTVTEASGYAGGGALELREAPSVFRGPLTATGNRAESNGGVVYLVKSPSLFLGPITLNDNHAGASGGALYAVEASEMTFAGLVEATGNSAAGEGGALYLMLARVEFARGLKVKGNSAVRGGGVAVVQGGSATVKGSMCVQQNSASEADGGAGFLVGASSVVDFAADASARQNFGSNTAAGAEDDIQLWESAQFLCGGSRPRTAAGTYSIEGPVCGARCNDRSCSCPATQPFSPMACGCKATLSIKSFTATPSEVVLGSSTEVRVELGPSGAGASVTLATTPNKTRCSPDPVTANRQGTARITCFFTAAGSFEMTAEARKGAQQASMSLQAPVQVCSPFPPSGAYQQSCRGCSFSCASRILRCSECLCPCHSLGSDCVAGAPKDATAATSASSSSSSSSSSSRSSSSSSSRSSSSIGPSGQHDSKRRWCRDIGELDLGSCPTGSTVAYDASRKALTCM